MFYLIDVHISIESHFASPFRIEGIESTMENLRLQKDQMQSEVTKKKDVMESVTSTLTLLEQENAKFSKVSFFQFHVQDKLS